MTAILSILAVTLIITGAAPWAIGIVSACTVWALILDTRAAIINRRNIS